jgi:hypothetical protein
VRAFAAHEDAALGPRAARPRGRLPCAQRTATERDLRAEAQLSSSLTGLLPSPRATRAAVGAGFQCAAGPARRDEDRLAAAAAAAQRQRPGAQHPGRAFPSSLVASAMSVERAEYVELEPVERDRLELPPDLSPGSTPLGLEPPRP